MADRRNQSGACALAEYLRLQHAFEPEDRDTLVELLSLQRIETPPRTEREPQRCRVQPADPCSCIKLAHEANKTS